MWLNHKFFKYGTGTLLTLLIIFMLGKIDFFLLPFKKLIAAIFAPILASFILYYILRPLVRLFQKVRIPKTLSIILTFIVVIVLIIAIATNIGVIVVEQFNSLMTLLYDNFDISMFSTDTFLNNKIFASLPLEDLKERGMKLLEGLMNNSKHFFVGVLSTITNISTIIVMIPFILFYFLKDDRLFVNSLLERLPKKYVPDTEKILYDIDKALSSYLVGQMTVALIDGILMYIGYLILGVKYPLILSIFVTITAIIPFFGPYIGIIPAIFVGLTMDPWMALKIFLLETIVQQIEGNFISPQIMKQKLNVHPVTVILLLMIGSALYGFVGLLVVVPTYAALTVTTKNVYRIYKAAKLNHSKLKPTD
jgi:predicted PurR-regulated permease PerM